MKNEISTDLLRQIEFASIVMENPNKYSENDISDIFSGISLQTIRRDAEKLREMGVDIHSRKQKYFCEIEKLPILNNLVCTYLALNKNETIRNLKLINKRFKNKTLSIFVKILKAINNKQILELEYGRNESGETIRRLITPLSISRTGRNFYLIGLDNDEENRVRFFLFEKIIGINFTGKKSKIKNLPDISSFLKTSWGAYTGGKEYDVILKFTKKAGMDIKDRFYIETQRIDDLDDSVIMNLKVKLSYEFIAWVMGWGAEVTVLEPAILKTEILKRAEGIINNY